MSRAFGVVLIGVLGFLYAKTDAKGRIRASRGVWASNYRGHRIPVVLGVSLAVAVGAPCLVVTVVFALAGHGGLGHAGRLLLLLAAGGLVFLAGVYDDLHPGSTRGLAAHLRAMLAGRLTTGGVKLLAGVAAAAAAGLAVGVSGWVLVIGVPAAAGATNTLNLLDVVPGRALKLFIPVAAVLTLAAWHSDMAVPEAAGLGAAIALLGFDLNERAMLGDAGANLLGFLVGAGLLASLPNWGLAVALVAVLALHALAETVTLSAIIRATPPLRLLDDLGREHPEGSAPAERPFSSG